MVFTQPPAMYLDPADQSTYDLTVPRWRSAAGRPLTITKRIGIGQDQILRGDRSLWRYRAAFPIDLPNPISLGEGCTPLVEGRRGSGRLFYKLEWFSPTGSFKDRGSSVMMSYLRDRGVRAVSADSSGNAGASIACYGAAGDMDVTIYAPTGMEGPKLEQTRAYGARVELVDGSREDAQEAAQGTLEDSFYASHSWQPFFLQGQKTLAYEIWEDLGFNAPDNVVVPVGGGSSLLGCFIGFSELMAGGHIAKMPRLYAAQPLNCSPLDAALRGEVDRPVLPTIAEGAAVAEPVRMRQMMIAVRGSRGGTVVVPEEQIVSALESLGDSGYFVEPTSATAAAAFDELVAAGAVTEEQTTVVVLSGTGLKSPAWVGALS